MTKKKQSKISNMVSDLDSRLRGAESFTYWMLKAQNDLAQKAERIRRAAHDLVNTARTEDGYTTINRAKLDELESALEGVRTFRVKMPKKVRSWMASVNRRR